MKITSIQNNTLNNRFTTSQTSFGQYGKPLTLQEIVKKNEKIVPNRVLLRVREILANITDKLPSLKEIHLSIYAPLLECKTLDEAIELFPEFSEIEKEVKFIRNSRYKKEFMSRTDSNFALKMLQEVWAKLKTKDEIAKELGMSSKNSLEWPLKKINFVSYLPNYKIILNASDAEGNKIIAEKTREYNRRNPAKMYAKNKRAAQACKTQEYREAASKRMKEYDIKHPERIEKIKEHDKLMWSLCPEIKEAMSEFVKKEPAHVRSALAKRIKGYPLNNAEKRILKGLNERFWQTYPEYKKVLADANKKALEIRNKKL